MIKPTYSYVVLSEVTKEMSKGGIILVESKDGNDTIKHGKVEAIGDNVSLFQNKIGTEVLFSVNDALETTYDGQKLFVVKQENVLAVV